MKSPLKTQGFLCGVAVLFLLAASGLPALARDASFMDPGSSGAGDEAVSVEPKGDVDTGESTLGVVKRTTLFFVNQTGLPVQVEKVAVNSDGNVAAELSNDDCTKQGTIAPQSRCSVEVSVTPSSPGAWSVDVLLTHNGAGRIARGKLSGKTAGATTDDKKQTGLSPSNKEVAPVNFGEVDVGDGKAVRSALMVNDSTEPITIYSIDVIEADNGLKRLDQGCAVDMELKPGESCPVTLLWAPTDPGQISTDLIIRHSGRLGFSVIPVRGTTKGGTPGMSGSSAKQGVLPVSSTDVEPAKGKEKDTAKDANIPPPPGEDTSKPVEKVAATALAEPSPDAGLHLIGTVGSRGIFLKPDGTTAVAGANDEIETGEHSSVTVVAVTAKSAEIMVKDKKKTLKLEAAAELVAKAHGTKQEASAGSGALPSSSSSDSKTGAGASTSSVSGGSSPAGSALPANTSGMGGTGGYK